MRDAREQQWNLDALDSLPPLPQVECLRQIASRLWERDGVVALWLGGSFARGEADQYSDLDLRVAVVDDGLKDWLSPDLSVLIGEVVVGGRSREWDGNVFHHLLLSSGIMLDLLVQGAGWEPPQDFTLILGCRDDAFAEKLARAHLPSPEEPCPADPEIIRRVIVDFWTDSHKHVKVLSRRLDMLALIGLALEQPVLMRLWFVEATGRDGGVQAGTIHSLTQTVRTVMTSMGPHGLEILGTPRADRADIIHTVESNREEVAHVGRRLAERLGFKYPDDLEQTVREAWRRSLNDTGVTQRWPRKRLGAAAAIRNSEGHFLLVKHGYGPLNWELPGGAAESSEAIADTAVREVREETGLRVIAERLTGLYYESENDSHHFVFECVLEYPGQELCSISDETTDCGYFAPDALPRPISDFTVQRIQDALVGQSLHLPVPIGPRQWLE